jgi:cullin 1
MIGRMKHICGAPFTSKLEGMLNDFAVGEDMHREFSEELNRRKAEGAMLPYELQVQVLTTGFWPAQKLREINLPTDMTEGINFFTHWYTGRYNHRLLKWVYTLGDITLVGSYDKKKYNIVLTTIQGLVLLAFSGESAALSFDDVKQRLGVAEVEVLKRILHSLSCGKHKLLIKSPASKSVSTSDSFQANPKFTEKLRTFRVPMASLDDTNAAPVVHESRGFAIDAAIVRIMKARRRLSHNDLINEVFHQLRYFQPQPKMVKQRIEQLIEREYLKRDENDNKMYEYLP